MILKTKNLWLVLGGASAGSGAGGGPDLAPREAAQIEFGTLALYPSLQIVDAGFDDNVFNDSVGAAARLHADRGVASARGSSSRLERAAVPGRQRLRLVPANSTSERSNNTQYAVRFNMSASRFKPFIGAEHVRTRSRRSPEIDARARRVDRNVLGGLAFEVSPRTALTASVRLDDTNYEEGESFRNVALDDALNRSGRGSRRRRALRHHAADDAVRHGRVRRADIQGIAHPRPEAIHGRTDARIQSGGGDTRPRRRRPSSCSSLTTRRSPSAWASPIRRCSTGRSMDGRPSISEREEISVILIRTPNPTIC